MHKNFDPNNNHTGFERLPSGALNNYQLLQKEISIDREGFLYIFVANESPYDQGVWFDDFTVEVIKSPVAALSDYYPFGMLQAGNSTNSSDPLGNKYLYNGKELQEDLGLETYSYEFRMYDPGVGRWWQQDPIIKENMSLYSWVTNNPIRYYDILGLDSADHKDYFHIKVELSVGLQGAIDVGPIGIELGAGARSKNS